jgi:hypothetical protein
VTEEARLAEPRSAVQQDQRWVGDALAGNHHPLIEPAESPIRDLGDAAGHDLALRPTERWRVSQMSYALAPVPLSPYTKVTRKTAV